MMKKLTRFQGLAASELIMMTAALYFATGYGVGVKLDDNQLMSYVLAGLLLGGLIGSFFTQTAKQVRLFSLVLSLGCLIFLGEVWFGSVNFNEAFWYFIPGVVLISMIVLVESGILFFQLLLPH
ncbi:hypothetical protein ACFP1L_11460 [Lactiplantibacillus nangangensis]|uniref:Integral membrane protein n=1 Tax=Lactiplantibacillus nangangensis TaxID=2559917 RepID=A0ABW1SMB4_9LACO|nr:hypothetical protein [Lactiplantibacillus nangangensis]